MVSVKARNLLMPDPSRVHLGTTAQSDTPQGPDDDEKAEPGKLIQAGHRFAQPGQPGSQVRGPILVVEDDPGLLGMVRDILEAQGYVIATAPNGQAALEALERTPPSLILLDMRMPIMDGWAFVAAMKERGVQVPVVVMTAAQSAEGWASEIDAAAHLGKPFGIRELISVVENLYGPPTEPPAKS